MGKRSNEHIALGAAIRDLRERRGISQERLAGLAGMDRTYVGGIERGERNVAYANLRRLARALDVEMPELMSRAQEHEAGG